MLGRPRLLIAFTESVHQRTEEDASTLPQLPGALEEPLEEPTFELVVTARTSMSRDIVSLTLSSPSTDALPIGEPGSHIDLLLPDGLVRQYSLCGPVEDRTSYRIGVLRDPASRGGSRYVHESLHPGDTVVVRGPRNHVPLVPSPRYLFAAGGIGVTPLLPMASEALRKGAEIVFLYCARSREAMGYLSELQQLLGERLIVHADEESGIFDLQAFFAQPQAETEVYACGPAPFLDATLLATQAWRAGTVHVERFAPLVFDEAENVPFDVELTRSGQVLHVPADQSILEVLTAAGARVLSSCTEGTCGTCEVGVVGGGPLQHRDAVLSDEERDSGEMMMVCVSRCSGARLLLDL